MTIFFEKVLTKEKRGGIISNVVNLGVAQLVARYLGVVEAASSSLVTQTKKTSRLFLLVFLYFTRVFGTFSVSENPFFLASGFASF